MLKVSEYSVQAYPGAFTIDLPEGAQILSAQVKKDQPQIWVLVDPDRQTETRHFITAETGDLLITPASQLKFIGTFLLYEGHFSKFLEQEGYYILHLFERIAV